MWQTPAERLALLELLVNGSLVRRRGQAQAWDALAELPWTRATGRRDEIALVPARRHELVALLHRVWPPWGEALAELTARGFAVTPRGWSQLEDAWRAEGMPDLPDRLNRRTAAALSAPHAKSTLTARRLGALGDLQPTHDGTVRLRPPSGLVARTRRGQVDLGEIASVLGEIAIPERAFLEDLVLEGSMRAVLLVENLGAWRDLQAPPQWLLAHVPGWDTATVMHLLERVAHVPVVHFGDLDPNGVRIFLHLRRHRSDLRWLVPAFWAERVDGHARPVAWPDDLDTSHAPPLVHELVRRGLWLEQETIVLDPRLGAVLEASLDDPR